MSFPADDLAWKKGTAEFLVLAQLADGSAHGYEIARQISDRSQGVLAFNAASLYPVLYRLERRGLIAGRWVEGAGERRRRSYRLTASGRRVLGEKQKSWEAFMQAVSRAGGLSYA